MSCTIIFGINVLDIYGSFRSRKAQGGKEDKGIRPAVISGKNVDKNLEHVVSCLHGLDASDDETPVPTSQYIKHMVAEEREKKAKKGNTLTSFIYFG